MDSGTLKTSLEDYTYGVESVVFLPDGKTLASASGYQVRLWDLDSGILKTSLEGHTDWVSVVLSPDGTTLASASYAEIRLWDPDSGTLKTSIENPDGGFLMAFAPDGETLASVSGDQIRLWDTDSGTLKTSLEGHTNRIYSVEFSPDGTTLASASYAGIRLWDTDSGTLKTSLEGHTNQVYSVEFSPDGKILASASGDGTILLWDMAPYITPSTPTAIELSPPLPTQTTLLANFPNPFNPDTYIPYQLHAPAQVRLMIYDVRGALVREIDLGYRTVGQYLTSTSAAHWDGRDHRGQRVASGVYLYHLQAGPVAHVRKMVLVK